MSLPSQWRSRLVDGPPLDPSTMRRAQARLDDLTKPRGSLGQLEPLVVQLAGIRVRLSPALRSP
nr:nicotinate-nucleotide--dimethylbenzimidazole phosphoribosyltransferase [Sulfobacillus harzensis]